jgi:hypothetical protein
MGFSLFQVPMVEQGANPICWVACAAMILSYKRSASVTIASLIGSDPAFSSIPNPADGGGNSALGWSKTRDYLTSWGFVCETQAVSPTSDYVEQRLDAHGPLLFSLQTSGFPFNASYPAHTCVAANAGHSIVLVGLNTDDNTCAFKNPWGETGIVPTDIVLEFISTSGTDPSTFPLAYVP